MDWAGTVTAAITDLQQALDTPVMQRVPHAADHIRYALSNVQTALQLASAREHMQDALFNLRSALQYLDELERAAGESEPDSST